MNMINTTLGQISLEHLGKVNVHDHIILDATHNKHIPEDFHHTDVRLISVDLINWKDAGGGVIVDSSPIGAGRNILLLEESSRISEVPIIVSTGFHKLTYYNNDHWLYNSPKEKLREIFIKEIIEGVMIDDQNPNRSKRSLIKANMIKIGIDEAGITPTLSKVIHAAASASHQENIPCMIHTEPGVPFFALVDTLKIANFPPNKLILCHMGKSFDQILHQFIAERGYFLEFDEMIRPAPSLKEIAEAILQMFEKGFGKSILFAGDLARRSYWSCYGGSPGLGYLVSDLEQEFLELGLSQFMLDQIWIKNPRSLFS